MKEILMRRHSVIKSCVLTACVSCPQVVTLPNVRNQLSYYNVINTNIIHFILKNICTFLFCVLSNLIIDVNVEDQKSPLALVSV